MFSNDVEGSIAKVIIKFHLLIMFCSSGSGNFMEFLEEMETSPSNGGDEHFGVDMDHN
jgi:hypothetical protein